MNRLIEESNVPIFPLGYENSGLTHLIAALFLSADCPMAMFSFYADASGRDETDYLAVAAFVASADEWLRFNKDWSSVLNKYGVKYLRMSEFTQSYGQFLGWKDEEQKRRDFLIEAEQVMASYARYWSVRFWLWTITKKLMLITNCMSPFIGFRFADFIASR